MKFDSFVALLALMAIVGLTAGAADFDSAEKRAVECCKKTVPIDCSLGVANDLTKRGCKLKRDMGLDGHIGMTSERKELKAIVKEALPLVRNIGISNWVACVTKWQDHTECCRTANLPDACLYLCDYHKAKHYNEEENEQAFADLCGQCQPHLETINKCIYAD